MTVEHDDEVARLRVPPHSSEAEQSLLGAILIDNRVFDRVTDILSATDFYRHEHRTIYEAIAGLVLASRPADVITVFEKIQANGKANDVGGLAYINELAQGVPSVASARRYAEIIRERSMRRELVVLGDTIAAFGFKTDEPLPEQINKASEAFGQIHRRQTRKTASSVADLATRAIARYTDMHLGHAKPGIATGIEDLDAILSGRGLRGGKVYGIAARPSVGKSSLARAIGINVAMQDHPVLILSQEMPEDENADCIISALGEIDNDNLQTGKLTDADWGRLTGAVELMSRLPMHIDDEGGLTLAAVRSKARSVKGLKLLVVDYLQLMRSTLKNENRVEQIGEISRGLKQLAMDLGIPIIVLSQLNRAVEGRGDKEPELSDLRGSGDIEQDLDVALLLWTVRTFSDYRLIGCKIAKQRGGKLGRFPLEFRGATYNWKASSASIDAPTATERRARPEL